jgi:DNA polymerase III epsilon subunit-like protein
MNENLLRFNKNQKYIFFDFETCSLNLGSLTNKPWQLGFIIVENQKIIKKSDYWIDWGDDFTVPSGAAKMTGWTKAKYLKNKKGNSPEKVLKEFEHYLYDKNYINVGHNILGFDVYVHGIYRSLLNMQPDYSYVDRSIDTLCLAKAIKNNINFENNESFQSWQFKLNNMIDRKTKKKLIDLCNDYDIKIDENKLHDAMYDIEQNYLVYNKMIWQLDI